MQSKTAIRLSRDCESIQIPVGNSVTLHRGLEVDITQRLGGNFTVHAMGGLFRIAGKDADALGLTPADAGVPAPASADGPLTEEQVWEVLRSCYDPEIPVNIVDLGLIYDLRIEPASPGSGDRQVYVKMTLTAPGCGMGGAIAGDAQQKIIALPGVAEATVEVVWDPPWHQSMITPQGRRVLGLE